VYKNEHKKNKGCSFAFFQLVDLKKEFFREKELTKRIIKETKHTSGDHTK